MLNIGRKKDQLISQSLNDKGVCRTAPATPGLLNIGILLLFSKLLFNETLWKIRFNTKKDTPGPNL